MTLEVTCGVYQRVVAAYRARNRTRGKAQMTALIKSIASGVPDRDRQARPDPEQPRD